MNRRRAVIALATAPLIAFATSRAARAEEAAGSDAQRLLGVWRSDADKTMANWQFKESASPEARSRIAAWFGRLTINFTRTHMSTEFDGTSLRSRYRVLTSTSSSVTVEYRNEGKPEVEVVYLGEGFMFKRVGSSLNFEYFVRVAA